jgi:hypothetical protein
MLSGPNVFPLASFFKHTRSRVSLVNCVSNLWLFCLFFPFFLVCGHWYNDMDICVWHICIWVGGLTYCTVGLGLGRSVVVCGVYCERYLGGLWGCCQFHLICNLLLLELFLWRFCCGWFLVLCWVTICICWWFSCSLHSCDSVGFCFGYFLQFCNCVLSMWGCFQCL